MVKWGCCQQYMYLALVHRDQNNRLNMTEKMCFEKNALFHIMQTLTFIQRFPPYLPEKHSLAIFMQAFFTPNRSVRSRAFEVKIKVNATG